MIADSSGAAVIAQQASQPLAAFDPAGDSTDTFSRSINS